MDISSCTALVTGANRGLGRHLSIELLRRGARVYAGARNPESITVDGVIPLAVDVTDAASVAAAAEAAGDVTLLVNNAGITTDTNLLTGGLDDIHREMDTNYFGTLSVVRAFTPVIERNGGGAMLNVLSVLSWLSLPEHRRVLRIQGGGLVHDECAARGAGRPGHRGDRSARRPDGHRHGGR